MAYDCEEGYYLTLAKMNELYEEAKQEGRDYIELPKEWYEQYPQLLVSPPSRKDIKEMIAKFEGFTEALKRWSGQELNFKGMPVRQRSADT